MTNCNANEPKTDQPLFDLGLIHGTDVARNLVTDEEATAYVSRHQRGDWGTIEGGSSENARSLALRAVTSYVMSEYPHGDDAVMVFTALHQPRSLIFCHSEISIPFMLQFMQEMLDVTP